MRKRFCDGVLLLVNALLAVVISVQLLRGPPQAQRDPALYNAGLDHRISTLDCEGERFDEFIERLSAKTGARIGITPAAAGRLRPQAGGIDHGMWLDVHDVSLATAIELAITQVNGEGDAGLSFDVTDSGTIVIGLEDELPRVVRSYDVADLYSPAQPAPSLIPRLQSNPTTAQRVEELVADCLPPDASSSGGDERVKVLGTRLIVVETRRGHAEVQRLLEDLGAAVRSEKR